MGNAHGMLLVAAVAQPAAPGPKMSSAVFETEIPDKFAGR
jgi:hypothetical protein